jgi:GNAT superfamily N-acetyltransferase
VPHPASPEPEVEIRPATAGDAQTIIGVILDAGTMFRGAGMGAVADNPPPTPEEIRAHIQVGHVWVAQVGGSVAGCTIVRVLDGDGHIEQVSTARTQAGRGIGRLLVARAEDWARAAGYRRMTLTTFTNVAWNAPYYRRLGYRTFPAGELGPELTAVRAEEARSGLEVWGRCAMVRELRADG